MRASKAALAGALTAFCLVFAAGVLRADYPLEVKWTFEVPPNVSELDVQYWMSDSVIGYAYLRSQNADTVHWVGAHRDSLHHYILPEPRTDWTRSQTQLLGILRMASRPLSPVVSMAIWECWIEGVPTSYLRIFDLRSDSMITSVFTCHLGIDDEWSDIGCVAVWPPAPEMCRTMALSGNLHYSFDRAGCDGFGNWGRCCLFDFTDESLDRRDSQNHPITPFRLYDSNPVFVSRNDYYLQWYGDWCGSGSEAYWWASALTFGSSPQKSDTFRTEPQVPVAQTDANGFRRAVFVPGLTALDPQTWDTLWQRPPIPNNGVHSARLTDSPDERILLWHAGEHRFTVLSAADGSVLGRSAPVLGNLHHIIKRRHHPDEIVTVYDPPGPGNWQVLVYAFRVPSVERVTLCYVPAADVVRLRWPPREGADQYHVMAASAVDGEYEQIASVPATQSSYDIPLTETESLRFFHVVAVFDSAQ